MGSNQTKSDFATCVGSSVDPYHKQSYGIHASHVYLGDVYQQIYNTNTQQQQKQQQQHPEELEQKLRRESKTKLEELVGSQEGQPVPLQLVHETQPSVEEFGDLGNQHLSQHGTCLTLGEIFPAAWEFATHEAEAYSINNEARSNFIRRHGNCVGVVGIAGIGKTTFAKQYIRDVEDEEGFNFFVQLRDLDFDKEITLLQFLLKSTLSNWEHKPEDDAILLNTITSSSSVNVVMDGLDEVKTQSFSHVDHVVSLHDRAKPACILKNLLSGRILPNAKKMLVSRPGAYQKIHPEYKPRFTVKVMGLDEDSQQLLCIRVCRDLQEAKKLQSRLLANPGAKSMCFIPMFCKLVTSYALHHDYGTDVLSITDVFTSFVLDVVKSKHFNGELEDVLKLSHLAFYGMTQDQFIFEFADLEECGIDVEGMEAFINTQISMNESQVRVLDGEKRFYFSHLTWQEFFAALYMMFVMEQEDWKTRIEGSLVREDRWEMVLRFLFGFLSANSGRKLSKIFPRLSRSDVESKKLDLISLSANMAKEYDVTAIRDFPYDLTDPHSLEYMAEMSKFKHRPPDTALPKICHFCHESKNDGVASSVRESLPHTLLLSRRLLPSDVASFCHVMASCSIPIHFNVGIYSEPAVFGGKSLIMFLQAIADSPHKINKFHVSDIVLTDFEVFLLSQCLPDMKELTLRNCNITPHQFEILFKDFGRRNTPMTVLDLSENKTLTSRDWELLFNNLHLIQRLTVVDCKLAEETFQCLARNIATLNNPMTWLDVSENHVTKTSLLHLCSSLFNINQLHLCGCGLVGDEVAPLCDAIACRVEDMHLLSLNGNSLGHRGIEELSRCVTKLDRLLVGQCEVSDSSLESLSSSIATRSTPMKLLNVSVNPIGAEAIQHISTCVHLIDVLWIRKCDVTGRDIAPLTAAIAARDEPMTWLRFSAIDLGLEGIDNLSRCVANVRMMSLCNCAIQGQDIVSLLLAIEQLEIPMDFLNISDNPVSDKGGLGLVSCIHNIKYLWLHDCGISHSGVRRLQGAADKLSTHVKIYGLHTQ